jgi:outer membrane protein
MKLRISLLFPLLAVTSAPAFGQQHLTLDDAVARALAHNPAVEASQASVGEASARIGQARSGYLPKLDLVEGAQRGNAPVFAFSTLLSARQFAASDFAIDSLNRPAAITAYQTSLAVEQPIFDGFRTRSAVRAAEIGRDMALAGDRQTRQALALATTRAYGQVLLGAAGRRAADAAVRAAEEDVKRAERRRDAGMVSEADVLALQVQLARMRERLIQATSDEQVARAELNQAMAEPLDQQFELDEPPSGDATVPAEGDLEREALSARPELQAARLQQELAAEDRKTARAAFLPQVSLQGVFNLNGASGSFTTQPSAWLVGVQARWNLFSGLSDVARLRETGFAADRASAEHNRLENAVRVEVRAAAARVQSAAARVKVGQAAVMQAQESQRIIRDRYDAGLVSVNDVLRAANALLDAESQRVGARVDLFVSQAMLERALGRAPGESK